MGWRTDQVIDAVGAGERNGAVPGFFAFGVFVILAETDWDAVMPHNEVVNPVEFGMTVFELVNPVFWMVIPGGNVRLIKPFFEPVHVLVSERAERNGIFHRNLPFFAEIFTLCLFGAVMIDARCILPLFNMDGEVIYSIF